MAISVDIVYKTVLLILNKEQRGYMTPDEFNKIGSQVQLEIFEKYFEDLNQYVRMPQTDVDYSDRVFAIEEKLEYFRTSDLISNVAGQNVYNLPSDLYKLGNVRVRPFTVDTTGPTVRYGRNESYYEAEKITRGEYILLQNSKLLQPDYKYPKYLYENNSIRVLPESMFFGVKPFPPYGTIPNNEAVEIDYIKKPQDINWAYTIGTLGQYQFNNSFPPSVDFELEFSEKTNVILKILAYAGLVIRDPSVIQAANQELQLDEVNSKR
jgi:hypothetical protein